MTGLNNQSNLKADMMLWEMPLQIRITGPHTDPDRRVSRDKKARVSRTPKSTPKVKKVVELKTFVVLDIVTKKQIRCLGVKRVAELFSCAPGTVYCYARDARKEPGKIFKKRYQFLLGESDEK